MFHYFQSNHRHLLFQQSSFQLILEIVIKIYFSEKSIFIDGPGVLGSVLGRLGPILHRAGADIRLVHGAGGDVRLVNGADSNVWLLHGADSNVQLVHGADRDVRLLHLAVSDVHLVHVADSNVRDRKSNLWLPQSSFTTSSASSFSRIVMINQWPWPSHFAFGI